MSSVGTELLGLENKIKKELNPRIDAFKFYGILEKYYDRDNAPSQEYHLVEDKRFKWQVGLRINDLTDESIVQHVLKEVGILEKLELHKRILNLLGIFRHRQYVGLVFPAFLTLKEKMEARKVIQAETKPNAPALFHRDCVAMVLRPVIKALRYIHSKGIVHTQLQAINVYMNEKCYVKLGGFGYARSIGSRNRVFNADYNLYPPEVLLEEGEVTAKFDSWGLGMLAIEVISGKRYKHSQPNAKNNLHDFLSERATPPTLKVFAPKTYDSDDKCIYHDDVEDFLSQLLEVEPRSRMDLEKARAHPFVGNTLDKKRCAEVWKVKTFFVNEAEAERSLRHEMEMVKGDTHDFKADFLKRLVRSSRLAAKEFYPVFDVESDKSLMEDYYLVQLTIPIPPMDEGWSRDVLDISQGPDGMNTSVKGEEGGPKYVNRNDQIFFVKKDWTEEERQVFIGLQVCRWYHRGFIEFGDAVKIADDIDDLFNFYISDFGNNAKTAKASDIYLYTPLRFVYTRRTPLVDKDRSIYNAYINIAVAPESMKYLKKKYDDIANVDKSTIPEGQTTLHQSVIYRELDLKRFRRMEAAVLGEEKAKQWESMAFDVDERRNTILPLVYERRCNRNGQYKSDAAQDELADEHDHDFNQIRTAKIWSELDRKFLDEKYGAQLELHHPDAINLFGHPFEKTQVEKTLDADLYRGQVYQTEDYISPFSAADAERDVTWAKGYYATTTPSKRKAKPVTGQADNFDQSFDASQHVMPSPAPKMNRAKRAPNP
ncbi:unnamed protein product [Bursaphelenchus okinawaensis]|uniref:Protein kinase domain-containing protein n=1 Tax=Bursaphelenchus okinawaensis TaxID=465554 RepID=A0A811LCN9_9BILA|nr:unnamed protein product [Bursaphelenchus okinawaensis]CAG9120245.1 unnamed protein product [Bursaphelenchus okinawaensis]